MSSQHISLGNQAAVDVFFSVVQDVPLYKYFLITFFSVCDIFSINLSFISFEVVLV